MSIIVPRSYGTSMNPHGAEAKCSVSGALSESMHGTFNGNLHHTATELPCGSSSSCVTWYYKVWCAHNAL